MAKRRVLRTTPGWPIDVAGEWIRKGQIGEFPEAVVTGSRSCWLEVVATPPSATKVTKATKATKATKRKRATKATTGDRD